MNRVLAAVEGLLYIAIGVVLVAFAVPFWARVLIAVMVLATASVSTVRMRLARQPRPDGDDQ